MSVRIAAVLLALVLVATSRGFAEAPPAADAPPGAVDVALADLWLADQHGDIHPVPPDTRTIVFAADMTGSKIVNALLGARDADYLPRRHAVFIADIHGMPRIITRLFALPRMRGYPYRILLIDDAATGARFPRRSGEVTVLHVRDLRAVASAYVRDVAALTRALEGDGA